MTSARRSIKAGVVAMIATIAVAASPSGAEPVIRRATPGAPTAPRDMAATYGPTSVSLTWSAPESDGGSPILGYRACASVIETPLERPDLCQDLASSAASATIEDLVPGAGYDVSLVARNTSGTSDPVHTYHRLAPGPPVAMDAPPAYRGGRALGVAVNPPFDGGSRILSYDLCASTGSGAPTDESVCKVVSGQAQPWETGVVGLVPGTTYHATIRARNEFGAGPWSPASVGVVPFAEPATPTGVSAFVSPVDGRMHVSWDRPPVPDGDPEPHYGVAAYIGPVYYREAVYDGTGGRMEVVFPPLPNGTAYSLEIRAANAAGPSAPTPRVGPLTPVGPMKPAPFTSLDAFVERQLNDFTGSPGTGASRASTVDALDNGTLLPSEHIEGLLADPWYEPAIAPAARLYWASFGRPPDYGGLQYWTNKRREGTTLIRIAASFAGSSEFRRKYGSLSSAAFVDRVYANVLGRPADPGGRSYWIARLAKGTSRGQVMINFSESAEYVRKTAGRVRVVEVYAGMLERSPTVEELGTWADVPTRSVIDFVRLGWEYADRVGCGPDLLPDCYP